MLLMLTLACLSGDEPPPIEPAPTAKDPARVTAEALALAKGSEALDQVASTFSNRLHEASATDGLPGAIKVCSEEAQGMTALLSADTGARVGRSSLKLRNPANAGPPWVQDYLAAQEGKVAVDVSGVSEVHEDTARVARPIAIVPKCLACHGEHVDPAVQPLLTERYPEDKAVGYREGELRGVIWAEVPIL